MILNWYKRLEIAVNVAQGLDYLHSFAVPLYPFYPFVWSSRDNKPADFAIYDAKLGCLFHLDSGAKVFKLLNAIFWMLMMYNLLEKGV